MPATADAQGRIKCTHCGNTLWFLERDEDDVPWLKWNDRRRPGAVRTFRVQADRPGIDVLSIDCECGARWVPTPLPETVVPTPAPRVTPHPTPDLADRLRQIAAA